MNKRHAFRVLRVVCFAAAVTLALWVLLSAQALDRFGMLGAGVLIICALGYWIATVFDEW